MVEISQNIAHSAADSSAKEGTHATVETGLLVALPGAAIVLSVIVWITAVSRSSFWADDFLNVTHFGRTLGSLSDDNINAGKYIINVFWAIGTYAFGAGSIVPFLMLNALVFALGLIMWLRAGTQTSWSAVDAWWICGLFIAPAAWLPTVLWSSDITHSGGFLALGMAMMAHERAIKATTARATMSWSVAGGVAWTSAIVSNLLYIGLLAITAYCVWHQVLKLRNLGIQVKRAAAFVSFWSLLLPVVFFVTVGYPATTARAPYARTGLQFLHTNLRFYRLTLAPTDLLTALYIALLAGAAIGALAALRRRDYFPIAVLCAAGATALPALVQGQQRDIHYVAMPLLLVFSALAAGVRPVLLGESKRLKRAVLIGAFVTLVLLFGQSADLRSYFVQTPYGSSLASFRTKVATLTPAGGTICAQLNLDPAAQALFTVEMSGEDGFLIPPISAAQAYLIAGATPCPANSTHIAVSMNARGDFIASG